MREEFLRQQSVFTGSGEMPPKFAQKINKENKI